jgi:hypothetical protein
MRRFASHRNLLTNRSSQPLDGVMSIFDLMKHFFAFATLGPALGG